MASLICMLLLLSTIRPTAYDGELRRMVQYKEKAAKQPSVRSALLAYPVLMAADILLYDVQTVPVGDDQRQHLELARDLAIRFNKAYGETFAVPRAVTPQVAARVMDLQEPAAKMSKSAAPSAPGVLRLLDPPDGRIPTANSRKRSPQRSSRLSDCCPCEAWPRIARSGQFAAVRRVRLLIRCRVRPRRCRPPRPGWSRSVPPSRAA